MKKIFKSKIEFNENIISKKVAELYNSSKYAYSDFIRRSFMNTSNSFNQKIRQHISQGIDTYDIIQSDDQLRMKLSVGDIQFDMITVGIETIMPQDKLPEQAVIIRSPKRYLWVSDTRVTQDLYNTVMSGYEQKFSSSSSDYAQIKSVYEAVLFCNALSREHGLTPYYKVRRDYHHGLEVINLHKSGYKANGYRLLDDIEWYWLAVQSVCPNQGEITDYSRYMNTDVNRKSSVMRHIPHRTGIYDLYGIQEEVSTRNDLSQKSLFGGLINLLTIRQSLATSGKSVSWNDFWTYDIWYRYSKPSRISLLEEERKWVNFRIARDYEPMFVWEKINDPIQIERTQGESFFNKKNQEPNSVSSKTINKYRNESKDKLLESSINKPINKNLDDEEQLSEFRGMLTDWASSRQEDEPKHDDSLSDDQLDVFRKMLTNWTSSRQDNKDD